MFGFSDEDCFLFTIESLSLLSVPSALIDTFLMLLENPIFDLGFPDLIYTQVNNQQNSACPTPRLAYWK